jgi:hypothetical protein
MLLLFMEVREECNSKTLISRQSSTLLYDSIGIPGGGGKSQQISSRRRNHVTISSSEVTISKTQQTEGVVAFFEVSANKKSPINITASFKEGMRIICALSAREMKPHWLRGLLLRMLRTSTRSTRGASQSRGVSRDAHTGGGPEQSGAYEGGL